MSDVGPLINVLLPVVIGGVIGIVGSFVNQYFGQRSKDAADKERKRAEKLEELVCAVYEYDHWITTTKHSPGGEITMSLFPKIHAISDIYFPNFKKTVEELRTAADTYVASNTESAMERYIAKREGFLTELRNFAQREFQ